VVDTVGITTKVAVDYYLTPHTDKLHVVERYRLVDDGRTLEVTFTVDDPGAFPMPWSASQRYQKLAQTPMEEVVCAEAKPTRLSRTRVRLFFPSPARRRPISEWGSAWKEEITSPIVSRRS
jgi:hypothetical protein